MSEHEPTSAGKELADLKAKVAQLEDRLLDADLFASRGLSNLAEGIQRLTKAALDAHDRLMAIEGKMFPGMHADLDQIASIVSFTDPLQDQALDRRPGATGDETKK